MGRGPADGTWMEPRLEYDHHDLEPDFLGAERAAAHVIDTLVDLGGQLLYEKYIERKAYPFAAETLSDVLVAHLRMCFVNHDMGDEEGEEGWTIEDEVERSELDTWAGYVVPVISRARSPAPSPKEPGRRKRGSPRKKPEGKENKLPAPTASRIAERAREVDEYEDMLREYKIREEKRKRDAEEERRKRELDEAEKAAKLEKFREELSKKQITYDSQGQVLEVQPPNVNKLPPGVVSTGYSVRERLEQAKAEPKGKTKPRGGRRGGGKAKPRRQDEKDQFSDTFSRLTHSQPSAFEVMSLSEGVDLSQTYPAKRNKKGPSVELNGKMTRTGYRGLLDEGQKWAGGVDSVDSVEVGSSGGTADPWDDFNQQILKTDPSAWGRNPPLVKAELRDTTASAPSSVHNWKFKREAVGNLERLPRDRVAELGSTSGWRLPQPPLGATMGHGILKKTLSGRDELHYFPGTQASEDKLGWSGQLSKATMGKTVSLPELPRPTSYGSDRLMSTSSSFLPHVDPSVLDLNRSRREGGGVIQSSKQDILKSILRR